MINWRHWLLGLLTTFVAAFLGVLAAEYIVNRCNLSESSCESSCGDYTNIVLVGSRVLPAGVYVRFRNTGTNTIATVNFRFKYYEKAQLVEESDETYNEALPPGETTEGIITPECYRNGELTPILLQGRTVKVICTGGYTE